MSFIENLENRTFLSAAPVVTTSAKAEVPISLFDMVPHERSEDASGVPESPPVWTDTVTGTHFVEPLLSDSGRLQIFGSRRADQISVEQLKGLDTSSPLPAFVITQLPEFVEQSYPNGGTSLTVNRVMIDSQSGLLPDMNGGLSPAEQVLQQYQSSESGKDDGNLGYVNEVTIPGIERDIDNYKTNIETYRNVSMTRVRVGELYDVYVPTGVTMTTIAIDAGAGNDTVSIAPNVTAKTSILGGKGNDTLISGKMHTYLSGGAGNDRLVSRSTHGGTMEGDAGSDVLDCRVGKMNVSDADASDYVAMHGQTYPISTAASALGVSATRTNFSDIFITPDGLI